MKTFLKKSLSIVGLSVLLTGCGQGSSSLVSSIPSSVPTSSATSSSASSSSSSSVSSSSAPSSSSSSSASSSSLWIDYGSQVLTDDMIAAVGGSNVTLNGKLRQGQPGDGDSSTLYGVQVKMNEGKFWEASSTMGLDWTTGKEVPITTTHNFYANAQGKVETTHAPDINNNVINDAYSDVAFADSVFTNQLGGLKAADFAVDTAYTGTGYRFLATADAIANATEKRSFDNVYNSYAYIAADGTNSMFGGKTLVEAALYTDGATITGFGARYLATNEDFGVDLFTAFSFTIDDVGSTVVDLTPYTYTPYAIADAEKSRYAALTTMLGNFAGHDYTGTIDASDKDGLTFQDSRLVVTPNGWSGSDVFSTGLSANAYYGVHKKTDGKYDYYSGATAAALVGTRATYAPTHALPLYDFAPAIFQLDATKSTSTVSYFDLRSDFIDSYGTAQVAEALSMDSFLQSSKTIELAVNTAKNTLTITGVFDQSDTVKDCVFTQEFRNFGASNVIPADLADFTTYTDFVVPTSYATMDVTLSGAATTMKGDAVIAALFPNSASLIKFPVAGGLEDYYVGAVYQAHSDTDSAAFQITFYKEGRSKDVSALLKEAIAELTSLGYTLATDGSGTTSDNRVSISVGATSSDLVDITFMEVRDA